jgi:hypothetical protein
MRFKSLSRSAITTAVIAAGSITFSATALGAGPVTSAGAPAAVSLSQPQLSVNGAVHDQQPNWNHNGNGNGTVQDQQPNWDHHGDGNGTIHD